MLIEEEDMRQGGLDEMLFLITLISKETSNEFLCLSK